MATLLAGADAVRAALALAQEAPFITLLSHPSREDRARPCELLALAHPHRAILIDAARTQELGPWVQKQPVLGGLRGQAMGHALMATFHALPERIACANNAHALLVGNACQPLTLTELLHHYGLNKPLVLPNTGAMAVFAADAQGLAQLLQLLGQKLQQLALGVVSRIEAGAVSPVVMMEHHGMPVDARRLKETLAQEAQKMVVLAENLQHLLNTPIDAAASSADEAIITAVRNSGHALPSLSDANINKLPRHLAQPLGQFITLRRLSRTLGERFAAHIAADGRIHSHFVQIGARSGRMACTRPNLQAISSDPARRSCFRAPQGQQFVMGDYAACELRILADMSGDEALGAAIAQGTDLHAAIASTMFNAEVSKSHRPELRHMAKTIGFGLIYGMGIPALSAALNTDMSRAEALMGQFFAAFPKVQGHLEDNSKQALRKGYITTLSGRRCTLAGAGDNEGALLRLARNLPIQGTSADLIKVALARVFKLLRQRPSWALVHCIHDEIILMVPSTDARIACAALKEAMEGAAAGILRRTALRADVRAQPDWQAH